MISQKKKKNTPKKEKGERRTGKRERERRRGRGRDRRRGEGQRKRREEEEKGRKTFFFCNGSEITYRTGTHLQTTCLIKVSYSEYRFIALFCFSVLRSYMKGLERGLGP